MCLARKTRLVSLRRYQGTYRLVSYLILDILSIVLTHFLRISPRAIYLGLLGKQPPNSACTSQGKRYLELTKRRRDFVHELEARSGTTYCTFMTSTDIHESFHYQKIQYFDII